MSYWLFKSEPHTWSWQQQIAAGDAGEEWDGVRNFQARRNMSEMRIGDLGFFYHSGADKEIVGVVRVCANFHPDSTDASGRFGCVDVAAVASLPKPIRLAEVKAMEELADMVLVKNSRLSVQPVTAFQWNTLCRLGGLKEVPLANHA